MPAFVIDAVFILKNLLTDLAAEPTTAPLRVWANSLVVGLCVLLFLTPLSTKVGGALFVALLSLALWSRCCIQAAEPVACDPVLLTARRWLWICSTAVAARLCVSYAWGDPLGSRHFEIRLLLMALALFVLLQRMYFLETQKRLITITLVLAMFVALGVTYLYGRKTPTNPIPWAAGISFFSCVLMALTMHRSSQPWIRFCALVGSMAGVGAVIMSQSRGSYGIVLWAALLIAFGLYRRLKTMSQPGGVRNNRMAKIGISLLTAMTLIVVFFGAPRFYAEPVARMQEAWSDVRALGAAGSNGAPSAAAIGTSVGMRIHMWRLAFKKIEEAPVFGHGRESSIDWVRGLSQSTGVAAYAELEHLHNDPLNAWFEHGIVGLASYLSLAMGLVWLAFRHPTDASIMRLSLAGLAWMHVTSGLSNVNTGHNFYGVVLSVSIALTFLLSSARPARANAV